MTSPVGLPPYSLAPTIPTIGSASFSVDVQNFFAWQVGGATGANVVGLAQSCVTNATFANESAVKAAAAAAGANVELWDIAHNDYPVGRVVISPAALLAGAANVAYICKVATGTTHTDPYSDPAHWSVFSLSVGFGGAVFTSSTTLTSGSPFAVKISGGCGTWIKLPDVTTLQAGARYNICNAGADDVRVLDSTGAVVGFIRPRDAVAISCADTSTAAGGWIHGLEETGITQRWQALSTVTGVNNIRAAVRIDFDRVMFIVGGQSGGQLHAVVWSDSAGSIGATYLVRAAAYYANAVLCGVGQVMVVSCDNSAAMQGVVLTAAGTSITAGTVSPVTLSLSCTGIGQLIATPTGFALAFGMGSSGCVRGLAISGGSPVFGSENILTVYNLGGVYDIPRLYLSGNVVRTVRFNSAIEAKPFTANGSTLTAGTLATTATAIYTQYKTTLLNNGNLAVLHFNGGKFVVSIFKLSGTTESVYSGNVSATVTAPSRRDMYDMQPVGSNKLATFCYSHSSGAPNSALSVATVTDNSGSLSVGTIYQRILSGSDISAYLAVIPSVTSNESGVNIRQSSTPFNYNLFFDFSGASPALSKNQSVGSIPTIPSASIGRTDFCQVNGALCANASGVYEFNSPVVIGGNSAMLQSTKKYNSTSGLSAVGKVSPALQLVPSVRGENELSAYAVDYHGNENGTNYGITVTRIEICSN